MKSFATIESAHKNARNNHTKYNYVDLASINKTIAPFLLEHDLSVTFAIEYEQAPNGVVVCQLVNSKGETLRISQCAIVLEDNARNKKHDYGSAITYARKYCLKMLFNLSESDDDASKEDPKKYGPAKKKEVSDYTNDDLSAMIEQLQANPNVVNNNKILKIKEELEKRNVMKDLEPKAKK